MPKLLVWQRCTGCRNQSLRPEDQRNLKGLSGERKVRLIDFKMEFGVDADGKVILADEITPDTSRLWDWDTNEKLDKDVSAVIWAASKKPIRKSSKD